MVSFAGGLALAGFRPFIHTFGKFMYRRPYDQFMAPIAYPRRKVRMMAFLPGVTTPGGMTHQSIEDVSVMRSIPNMTILETGEATEVENICAAADSIDGPVWCRVLRGLVPRLFDSPIEVGQISVLSQGDDVLVAATGIFTEETMRTRAALAKAGVSIRHVHLHAIKPFNAEPLLDHIGCVRHGVATLECHVTEGGICSLVAETMADAGVGKRLVCLRLKDTYAHGGSGPYLMRYYGLDALALVRGIEEILGQEPGMTEADLAAACVEDVDSLTREEAL